MRLIDADALMPKLKIIRECEHQIYGKESWGFTSKCITAVEDAPTADTVARDIATIIENEKDMRVILQNAEQTITEETAIEFLQSTGWLERHDKALTEFLEYLWNVINPNEMEQYWSMFNAREEKSNE